MAFFIDRACLRQIIRMIKGVILYDTCYKFTVPH